MSDIQMLMGAVTVLWGALAYYAKRSLDECREERKQFWAVFDGSLRQHNETSAAIDRKVERLLEREL